MTHDEFWQNVRNELRSRLGKNTLNYWAKSNGLATPTVYHFAVGQTASSLTVAQALGIEVPPEFVGLHDTYRLRKKVA